MSTKTTFKRIALVAVAALGLGLMTSVAPANATTAASSFSLDTTSVTVVGNTTASGTALFKITVKNSATTPTNAALAAGDTITAAIIGVPAGTGSTAKSLAVNGQIESNSVIPSDLEFVSLSVPTTRGGAFVAQTPNGSAAQGLAGTIGSAHAVQSDSVTATGTGVYYLGVRNKVTANTGTYASVDQGEYTIRLRLTNSAQFVVQESTIKVKFVSSAADSGAAMTVTQTGSLVKGLANPFTTTNSLAVAMTNGTAGGRVYLSNGLTVATAVPAVAIVTTTGGVRVSTDVGANDALLIADNGVAGQDGVFTASATQTSQQLADLAAQNGTFGVYTTAATALDTIAVTTPVSLRVRYGATQTLAALTVNAPAAATAAGTTGSVTASGMSVLNLSGTLTADRAYVVPLSNKSVTFTILATDGTNAVADYPFIFTTTWSGSWAQADVTPVSGTLGRQTIRTDATGRASITLTNANPLDTARASIAITGFADDSVALAQTITWKKPEVTTVSVTPASYTAALKSTNTVSVTVLDQFLAPMAGQVLRPSFGGTATTTPNFQAAPATITTGANGVATFTWTDAGATALLTADTVTFTSLTDPTKSQAVTVTYSATAPTVASLKSYYSLNEGASSSSTLVPSTGVYADPAGAELRIATTRNTGRAIGTAVTETVGSLTNPTTNDLVFYYIQALTSANAAAAGVPVTITAPAGAFVLGGQNLPVSSTVVVTDANGYVGFVGGASKTGAIAFTITAGTVSTTVAQWVGNDDADGRFVTLTGPATGTANGEPNLYTGSVTDRHGNAVAGVSVTINAGGASSLGGGSTAATYITLADGKFTFTGTSFVSAGGAGTYTATSTSTGDYDSVAGQVSTALVDSSLKAGNKTASVSVTWAAGNSASADAASAAADAAAEATDAANAATDAANAAAEAADAATAAAQDAADAVAALATSVEGMVSALKKQITALTNLVIKIQKKVRA